MRAPPSATSHPHITGIMNRSVGTHKCRYVRGSSFGDQNEDFLSRTSQKRWAGVVGFSVVGFAVLWWAVEQWHQIREIGGSNFEYPTWRLLGWLLTLIAVGFMFSLAAGSAREGVYTANVGATVVVGILPLVTVILFWGRLSFLWSPGILRNQFGLFLFDLPTVVASCLIVGFLGAGLLSGRVVPPSRM